MLINGSNYKTGRYLDEYASSSLFMYIVLSNILAQLLLQVVFGALGYSLMGDEPMANLLCMLALQIVFLAVFYLKTNQTRHFPCFTFKKDTKIISYVLVVFIAIVMFVGAYLPTLWFYELLTLVGYVGSGIALTTTMELIFGLLVIVIVAPIVEELVFRAGILSGLRGLGTVKAVLLSSAMFVLFHMSPTQTAYQFVVGVVAGFIAVYSGNIILSMILHAVSNGLAIAISNTAVNTFLTNIYAYLKTNVILAIIVTVLVFAVAGGIVVVGLLFIKKKENYTPPKNDEDIVYKFNKQDFIDMAQKAMELRQQVNVSADPFSDEPIVDIQAQRSSMASELTDKREIDEVATKNLAETKKRGARTFTIIGMAVCVFMWVASLIAGIGF